MTESATIIEAPVLGHLTAREWHTGAVAGILAFVLALTPLRDQARAEPWYPVGGAFAGLLAAEAYRRVS